MLSDLQNSEQLGFARVRQNLVVFPHLDRQLAFNDDNFPSADLSFFLVQRSLGNFGIAQ